MAQSLPNTKATDFFSQLVLPFTGEEVFDALTDVAFFIKEARGEYVVVNETLVVRCGLQRKSQLVGRRADQVFPPPLGLTYRMQDEQVLKSGNAIMNQLELHFYPLGGQGWCLTNKFPLRNRHNRIVGLAGVSRDLQAPNERSQDYSQVGRTISQIQKHYAEPLRVKDLAAAAKLSEYQLEQRMKKIFQLTVGQIIQKTRMEAAVVRLCETADSIASVAFHCGYSDQSAFTRQFRRSTGLSPSEYRHSFGPSEAGDPPT